MEKSEPYTKEVEMAAIKGGYWGKISWVDLTNEKVTVEEFDDDFARKYLGGVGFATKIISGKVTRHTNPLGPGNVIVFATGPYQATNIPSSGRSSVCAKSPLTGYWGGIFRGRSFRAADQTLWLRCHRCYRKSQKTCLFVDL